MGLLKVITSKKHRFEFLANRGFYKHTSDSKYLKKRYFYKIGCELNLDNPKRYTEKLQWLKINYHKPEFTDMVDKFAVQKVVADKIGDEYLIPLVGGPWKSFDEIDFDKLPDKFVLKCTHDSGGLVICRDKKSFDKEKAKKKIQRCLKRNFYSLNREWVYKDVKPQIIAEQYMEDTLTKELRDYKFFCFDGQPRVLYVVTGRLDPVEGAKYDYFDMDYKHMDIQSGSKNAKTLPEKPQQFELMKELARKLSADIPHVRVDFYEVNGKVYFGELTFYHYSGMVPFEPDEWDITFGSWLNLPEKTEI